MLSLGTPSRAASAHAAVLQLQTASRIAPSFSTSLSLQAHIASATQITNRLGTGQLYITLCDNDRDA
jgi:hypothetical protein